MAPATISDAEALFPSTIIANGISKSLGSFFVRYSKLYFVFFDFVVTISSFLATKRFQILTASCNNPPGFPLKSKIIFVAPCCFRSNKAALVSALAFSLNFDNTI